MSDRRTPPEHLPRRALARVRDSDLYIILCAAIRRRRSQTENRFGQSADWIRLFALGILLIDLAALAMAKMVFGLKIENYWPGMASIFGGLLLAIIIIRIGRPVLYLDWIAAGLLHVGLGLLLTGNSSLSSVMKFIAFSVLLHASALLRIRIGMTLNAGVGTSWLTASGLTGLFCVVFAIDGRLMAMPINPDIVLAVDLLLMGISIAGFGLSLRRTPA